MAPVRFSPTGGNDYLEEDLCRTSGESVNTGNSTGLDPKTVISDEDMKKCTVNSECEKQTLAISYLDKMESSDTQKQKDIDGAGVISDDTSVITNFCDKQLQSKSEDKGKCNKDEVNSIVESDDIRIPEKTEPNDFLHLVNLDHQYLAASGMFNCKGNITAQQDKMARETPTDAKSYTMVKLYDKAASPQGRLRHILTCNESKNRTVDNEIQTCIPNAALIQKHFQDMLVMTSLQSIEDTDEVTSTKEKNETFDKGKEENSDSDTETVSVAEDASFVATDEDQSSDESAEKESNGKTICVGLSDSCGTASGNEKSLKSGQISKSASALCDPNVIERDIPVQKIIESNTWSRAQHDIDNGLGEDELLRFVFDKLLQRWGEYLQINYDKLQKFELENARQNAAVEVLEMLEDKERYVWQLLDNIMSSGDPI